MSDARKFSSAAMTGRRKEDTMEGRGKRGSEKLMAAWKARALSEESVKEIAQSLEKSQATVEKCQFVGGTSSSGLQLSLSYAGDDVPTCGNDILFWLKWHRRFGGALRPPRIIINGTPFPDLLRLELNFGHVPESAAGELAGDLANDQLKGVVIVDG